MSKLIDLTGQKFGRLTVVERAEDYVGKSGNRKVRWLCKCECGKEAIIRGCDLKDGHTKSCGCDPKRHNKKHGLGGTRLYSTWNGMKRRCSNPNDKEYKNYGGRGVKVCDEWIDDFTKFYNWAVSHGYDDNLTIDRIDVNGNYEPSNCRWVTMKTQQNNKSNNHLITYNGETHTMKQWSEMTGISYEAIRSRLRKNWTVEKTLTVPVKEHKKAQ